MTSIVDICNLALGNIRAGNIQNLNEASLEAQVCKQRYDICRDYMLRQYPWGFAHKVEALALLSYTPKEWCYAYSQPADALYVKHIVPNIDISTERTSYYRDEYEQIDIRYAGRFEIPYELGMDDNNQRIILTDEVNACAAYTQDLKDTTRFDSSFIQALAWYLASEIAIPIIGTDTGRAIRQECYAIMQQTINTAKAVNANERKTFPLRESDTISIRRT